MRRDKIIIIVSLLLAAIVLVTVSLKHRTYKSICEQFWDWVGIELVIYGVEVDGNRERIAPVWVTDITERADYTIRITRAEAEKGIYYVIKAINEIKGDKVWTTENNYNIHYMVEVYKNGEYMGWLAKRAKGGMIINGKVVGNNHLIDRFVARYLPHDQCLINCPQ